MKFFTTEQHYTLGTNAGGGHQSFLDTGQAIVASTSEPYTEATIERLLRAKAGPVERAPDDPAEFLAWLKR